LTERVRRRPYAVVLSDELEKAHPDVWGVLLQILEEGRLTDSQGRKVDFRNTIVIMTSNIGGRRITEGSRAVGFGTPGLDEDGRVKDFLLDDLKKTFSPELLNRMDEVVIFSRLTEAQLLDIAALLCGQVKARLAKLGILLEVEPTALELLAQAGAAQYGARPIRRAVVTQLEDALAQKILEGSLKAGDRVAASAQEGALVFSSAFPSAVMP